MKFTGRTLAASSLAALLLAGCSSATPSSSSTGVTVKVHDAKTLQDALDGAAPGETIVLAEGTYAGTFSASAIATATMPIVVRGTAATVIDAGTKGYGLHLENSAYWRIEDITISGGEKGIVLDRTVHSVLSGLHITGTGTEAVHLRTESSDNTVTGLTVDHTGLSKAFFGEGIYVGSATENWCQYTACEPDHSDRNRLVGNTFGTGITAQNIDIKEGTTGGLIQGNHFSGVGSTESNAWLQVKGNDWRVTGNTGSVSRDAGFQVLNLVPGWGQRNTFEDNNLTGPARGYAIWIQDGAQDNVVGCSNVQRGFRAGMSNHECSGSGRPAG